LATFAEVSASHDEEEKWRIGFNPDSEFLTAARAFCLGGGIGSEIMSRNVGQMLPTQP
jgi:hypothetical protein